jgi:hypothetical protein
MVFKQAMIHHDSPALEKLLADNLPYTHSGGQEQNNAEVIQSIVSGKAIIQKREVTDNSVRVLGKIALVKGKVDLWHSPETVVSHEHTRRVWSMLRTLGSSSRRNRSDCSNHHHPRGSIAAKYLREAL